MAEISRRKLLGASGIGAGAGLAAGIGGTYGVMGAAPRGGEDSDGFSGRQTVPFYGKHQAGVETPPQPTRSSSHSNSRTTSAHPICAGGCASSAIRPRP